MGHISGTVKHFSVSDCESVKDMLDFLPFPLMGYQRTECNRNATKDQTKCSWTIILSVFRS